MSHRYREITRAIKIRGYSIFSPSPSFLSFLFSFQTVYRNGNYEYWEDKFEEFEESRIIFSIGSIWKLIVTLDSLWTSLRFFSHLFEFRKARFSNNLDNSMEHTRRNNAAVILAAIWLESHRWEAEIVNLGKHCRQIETVLPSSASRAAYTRRKWRTRSKR